MFYASSLSEAEAALIAEAYFRTGKNAKLMAAALGVAQFDLDLVRHPLVKRQITKLAERMRKAYTLEDHLDRLQEIRDQAMEDGNLRIALAAELSVGKAAGLYEKIIEPDTGEKTDTKKLSTDEIKAKLANMDGGPALLPSNLLAEEEIPEGDEGF